MRVAPCKTPPVRQHAVNRFLTATLVSLLLSLLVLITASKSHAGTYTVVACDHAEDYGYSNQSWELSISDTSQWESFETCPSSSGDGTSTSYTGMGIRDVLGTLGGSPTAKWEFNAPTGMNIEAISLNRWIGKRSEPYWHPFISVGSTELETCNYSSGFSCENSGLISYDTTDFGSSESNATFGFYCDRIGCLNGATLHGVWSVVFGASVVVSEGVVPVVSGVSGGLVDAAGGVVSGVVGVSGVVSDDPDGAGVSVGSGVSGVSVVSSVDGVVSEVEVSGCDFSVVVPCPDSASESFTIDTTLLSDGLHVFSVCGVDAAGNEGCSTSWEVTVDNTPPAAPSNATATASGGGLFDVSWVSPSDLSGIGSAVYLLCAQQDFSCEPGSRTATGTVDGNGIQSINGLSVPEGQWVLYLWLEDQAGNGSPLNNTSVLINNTTGTTSSTSTSAPTPTATTTTTTAPVVRVSPKIKIRTLKRRGRTVTATGTCNKQAGTIKLSHTYRPKRDKQKARKTTTCKQGRWKLKTQLKKQPKRVGGKLTVTHKQTTTTTKQTTTKTHRK